MNEFKVGETQCEKCKNSIKWIGYKSVRSSMNNSRYEVYRKPNINKNELSIDFSNVDSNGDIICYCPICGRKTNINIFK